MTSSDPPPSAATTAGISVRSTPSEDWDPFVRRQRASVYFGSGWSLLARDVFGHDPVFIEARIEQHLVGVLPFVRQRGLLGNFATSIPFFNYGGALSADPAVALALMNRARDEARSLGCSYLELRDVHQRAADWSVRTDKVSMLLELPGTPELLGKALGSKLRSQIKRADREGIVVRRGGSELIDAFYAVFAENMRDLGTPVYPKKFFCAIVSRFPDATQLVVIEHNGKAAAAGFLVIDAQRAEIPWAACSEAAKPLGMNMKLYWEVLVASIERGCTVFDFGRSTLDSGTYKFKKQWGAQPLQLHWHRWERDPPTTQDSGGRGESRVLRYATAIWQRLPLRVANALGPLVSPGLPW
jgi:FemAB-related protein (PEP-CTERM system-associated)